MYADPALIRKHTVKLSLNDREAALVDALVAYTGEEKAAFIRALILDRAMEVLHANECASLAGGTRGTQMGLLSA
jgi:hypothetical protein